ncbi:helix-turn-helix transcriptional regulator [Streptomyces sp. 8P21H-1]|uniref:helix-turn-helix transcriptional regulator n=1 Tax=Streptomyces sp. 8P21H-1 TaxID=2737048 RepID=UPI0015706A86|nr:helix-turn-helix transcriptional regulator [Streptomyces sp. 8P21H-1]NSL43323.1 helix-turn-helix domain-containing protein [Streptomyces sp. 8P21H-1]
MDRVLLADFLRARREALQPEDVGLPRGQRRRTGGLRREEVAALAGMSADYYSRIEQQRGPAPSERMLAALARAMRLSLDERDHLFTLGGIAAPRRIMRDDHIGPAMMRVVGGLLDVPAMLMSRFGETLLQTPPAIALLGDFTHYSGLSRYLVYRWFTGDQQVRGLHPEEDHPRRGRVLAAGIRDAYTADPTGRAGEIVAALLEASPEFAEVWRLHEAGVTHHHDLKRYLHPELGELELYSEVLVDPAQCQRLLVFTATPGSPSRGKLQMLFAVGP